ncbi:MFS transporter [Pseudoroseicyclus tamaricis]|uniref:MFS transporter n=1 Tax=Pseudoroseicyclus tamaricis TaxID=2705421 RepID=A0A6B2JQS0_9RHOB|nr:MFS transporter [Pseudoroseicyclus tamaricis]NDV00498.1 MFS transporter [Pseudoroseicyclus tamaricis]
MRLLLHRDLALYLAGNFASITGTWAQRVVVFWLAWELTESPSILGVLAALELLPSIVFAPLAGTWADRRPAARLARDVQAASMLPPLALLAVALMGEPGLPALVIVTLATGVLNGLDHPLRLLLVGRVAPKGQVSGAVAWNSAAFNVGRMIGPALGGWAISAGQPEWIFGYNALSYLGFVVVLTIVGRHMAATEPGAASRGQASWRGLLRAFPRDVLLLFVLFAATAGLLRPIFELLPSFADSFSGGVEAGPASGAGAFSLLTTAQAAGALVGALAASVLFARFGNRRVAIGMAFVAALSALAFVATPNLPLAVLAVAVMSGATLGNGIATQVDLQTTLDESVRGRALALYTMTFRGLPALGALLLGVLGEALSVHLAAAHSALVLLAVWAVLTLRIRRH